MRNLGQVGAQRWQVVAGRSSLDPAGFGAKELFLVHLELRIRNPPITRIDRVLEQWIAKIRNGSLTVPDDELPSAAMVARSEEGETETTVSPLDASMSSDYYRAGPRESSNRIGLKT